MDKVYVKNIFMSYDACPKTQSLYTFIPLNVYAQIN